MTEEYTVITESTPFRLSIIVSAMLGNGYKCQGCVSVAMNINTDINGLDRYNTVYAQAMIKEY